MYQNKNRPSKHFRCSGRKYKALGVLLHLKQIKQYGLIRNALWATCTSYLKFADIVDDQQNCWATFNYSTFFMSVNIYRKWSERKTRWNITSSHDKEHSNRFHLWLKMTGYSAETYHITSADTRCFSTGKQQSLLLLYHWIHNDNNNYIKHSLTNTSKYRQSWQ